MTCNKQVIYFKYEKAIKKSQPYLRLPEDTD